MNQRIKTQVYKVLYQVLSDTSNEADLEQILGALMTEGELSALAKRLAIAVFLDKRQSYEHIRDVLKVSTATIANVSESMHKKGMRKALDRVKAEEWADVWSIRLSRALEKLMK